MINALVATPDDLDFRLHLRNEIIREGFAEALPGLREMDQDDLNVQLDIFDEHKDDDAVEFQHRFNDITIHMDNAKELFSMLHTVTEDTPSQNYFLSILQHLLLIRDDVFARPQYFKLVEECVSQIVLQKSGVDPDFGARKLAIDFESLVGKICSYEVFQSRLLRTAIFMKFFQRYAFYFLEGQMEVAQVEDLNKKMKALEEKV